METLFKSTACRPILVSQICGTGIFYQNAWERTKQNVLVHAISLPVGYQTIVLPNNGDQYLEFHHRVPAHLVSMRVWYRIHSNQLGFVTNAGSTET